MNFNNKLYELRKQKGFSQEELANRLNVTRQTVSKWELGETTPEMEKLIALSELFQISIDELIVGISAAESKEAITNDHKTMADLIDSHVLTTEKKMKVKKGLKFVGIGLTILFAIDLLSMVIYFIVNGFPR